MHPVTDLSSRLDSLQSIVSRAAPVHGAIALVITEKERVRDRGVAYRLEEMRLLARDGSEWVLSVRIPVYEKSLSLRSAAWDLHRERLSRRREKLWQMVRPPCLA